MSNWEVIEYDVVGNAEDGFEVNDLHHTSQTIAIDDFEEDAGVVDALVDAGHIPDTSVPGDIIVEGDEECLYVNNAADGYPILELHRTYEDIPGDI